MDLDPKALALFNEGYEKIVEGLGVLGYDIGDETDNPVVRQFLRT